MLCILAVAVALLVMVAHTSNQCQHQEAGVGAWAQVGGQPGLHSACKARLNYKAGLCKVQLFRCHNCSVLIFTILRENQHHSDFSLNFQVTFLIQLLTLLCYPEQSND